MKTPNKTTIKPSMNDQCQYPNCRCPFDMGSDNLCLIGKPNPKARHIGTAESPISSALREAVASEMCRLGLGFHESQAESLAIVVLRHLKKPTGLASGHDSNREGSYGKR